MKMEVNLLARAVTPPIGEPAPLCSEKFVDGERANFLLTGFTNLYEQKHFSDVILCAGGKEISCHRNILAISSPYFMAMFSNDLAESQQKKVELKEMNAQTLSLILDYIYKGEVDMGEDSVQSLLSAANLFQLLSLRNGCAEYMTKKVSVSNCIGMYFFAKAHQCEALAVKGKEIINRQFPSLCQEQEFLLLPADKLIEIIKDDNLTVSKEEEVYEACLFWINSNLEERKSKVYEILKHIRFANISSYYFCDKIDTNIMIQSCLPLREMLAKVKYYHMLRNRQAEVDLNLVPRKGMPYERGIITMANPHSEDADKKFNSMEILFPKTGTIRYICKLPQSLFMPGACISGENIIYLAGGSVRKGHYRGHHGADDVSSNLLVYDRTYGSWQVKCKMTEARLHFSLVTVDSAVFAIGGQSQTEILDSIERYDHGTNTWTLMKPMPQRLRCMSAVSYKGCLYVFGGESDKGICKSAYRFDPSENSWIELPQMRTPRALAGSVVFQDKIYVIGGNSTISTKWREEFLPEHCESSVEVFDPMTSKWDYGPELPNALCGAGVVKYGDTIMVVGGEDDKSWMAGLFTLKQEEEREYWVEGHELPTVMSTFGCVVANIPKEASEDQIT